MDSRSSMFPAVGMMAKRQQPAAVARALGMQQGGMQVSSSMRSDANSMDVLGRRRF